MVRKDLESKEYPEELQGGTNSQGKKKVVSKGPLVPP